MSDAPKNIRDKSGRFTSEGMKGNKSAKKDITKEISQFVTWRELHWASNLMCNCDLKEVNRLLAEGNQSLLTHQLINKIISGDMKSLYFLTEMVVGKATQQINQTTTGEIAINIDKNDANL